MMKTRKALLGILFLILWGLTFAPNTALAWRKGARAVHSNAHDSMV
jgi:hypothetical protein